MKLKRLELTNFRVFEQATFDFQPGMNLLVGINGAGKSSVLDALRIILSKIRSGEEGSNFLFVHGDFTSGHYKLTCELHFTDGRSYRISQSRRATSTGPDAGSAEISPLILSDPTEMPLAIYFSPYRSLPIDREPREQAGPGSRAAAYAAALSPSRGLPVEEFADWMLGQTRHSRENADPIATRRLKILRKAVALFLENDTRLEAIAGQNTIALLDKNENPLNINQLSEGERDLLALIFDLAYYLSRANPELDNPLQDGEGIVLIDELDLHLHPRWQRTIIEKLTTTFPNCQFIATTHSPQIIGECDPAGLILLTKEDGKVVVTQGGHQGFGLDSGWILEHLMGTAPRNVSVQKRINRVEDAIEEGNLSLARKHLADLRQTLHGDDGEVVRLEASINNLEALADEVDSETP